MKHKFNYNLILIILLLLLLLILLKFISLKKNKKRIENFNFYKKIKKKGFNTEILIPSNRSNEKYWQIANKENNLEDFKKRFYNHEIPTNTKLKKLIENINNQYVLDAGAHVGDTGIFLAKHLKDINKKGVKIIMVEPDKLKVDLINILIKINSLENYTEVYNYALGKSYNKGKIIKKGHSGMWKIEECNNTKCDIEINSIDNLFPDKNIGLLHLDLEGFEYKALQGTINILHKYKPKIILEIIHSDKKKIHDFLTNYNYKLKEKFGLDYFYE